MTTTSSTTSLNVSYLVPLPPTDVTKWYQNQLQNAAVRFTLRFDGIGNTISASTERVSCVIHIAEADGGSRIRIDCAPEVARPSLEARSASVHRPAGTATDGSSKDIEGWSNARWRMTQEQILNAFPGQAKILRGDLIDRTFGPRGVATMGIDSVNIGGIPVRVYFLFDGSRKLDGIRFVRKSGVPSATEFASMEASLAGSYGDPTLRAVQDTRQYPLATAKSLMSVWILPHSVIQLMYVPTLLLNLSIDKRNDETADSIMATWHGFRWFR